MLPTILLHSVFQLVNCVVQLACMLPGFQLASAGDNFSGNQELQSARKTARRH